MDLGDTVLYDGVREVAERLEVEHRAAALGGVQFPVTGPLRYTMTGQDAVELCALIRPRTAIPIHYEGWKHFRQGREDVERASRPRRRTCAARPLAADRQRGGGRRVSMVLPPRAIVVALLTPFDAAGAVDKVALGGACRMADRAWRRRLHAVRDHG